MAKNIKVVPSLGIIQLSGSNANTSISVTDDGQLQFGESSNTGSLNVTGDVIVQGSVTAQEFKTEFVSASIIYRSGSTKFGDTADDTHQFTGSLKLSGSATINAANSNVLYVNNSANSTATIVSTNQYLSLNPAGYIVLSKTALSYEGIWTSNNKSHRYKETDGTWVDILNLSGTDNVLKFGTVGDVSTGGDIAFYTSGSEKVRITDDGNVGIGTTSPGAKLEIVHTDASKDTLVLGRTDNSSYWKVNHAGNDFRLYNRDSSGADILFGVDAGGITQNNRVGIGTATPSVKLEVSGSVKIDKGTLTIDGETHSRIYLQNPGGSGDSFIAWYDSNASYDWYFGQTSENGGINLYNYTAGGTHTTFNTNGETYFNLGNVGIGTTNPATKIDVDGTGRITDTVYLSTNANSKTGIGTTSPGTRLDVADSEPIIRLTDTRNLNVGDWDDVSLGRIQFYTSDTTSPGARTLAEIQAYSGPGAASGPEASLRFKTSDISDSSAVDRMVIDAQGRVGIGTTSPTQALTVAGNILQTSNANFIGTRKILGRDSNGLDLMDDSGANGISIKDGGNVQFTDYGSGNNTGTPAYRLSVDSSGNIIEESLGAGAVDGLGSAGYITRWEDIDTITSSSIYENNGNIGIGTTSPGRKLHVSIDVNDEVARFTSTAGNDAYIELSNANSDGYSKYGVVYNDFVFIPSGSETVRFTDEGRVGIGTSNPQLGGTSGIDIYDTSYPQVRLHNSNTGTSVSDGFLIGLTATTVELKNYENTPIDISTNSQTRMRITGDGNVGIGTTSPGYKLEVNGATRFSGETRVAYDNPVMRLIDADTAIRYAAFQITTNGGTWTLSSGDSNTGSGTAASDLWITRATDGSDNRFRFYRDSYAFGVYSGSAAGVLLDADGTSYFNGGNVGIGTTSPVELLDVDGTARAASMIVEGIAYAGTGFQHWGDGGTGVNFPANDRIDLDVASTAKIRITNDTDEGILINPTSQGWSLGSYNNTSTYADIATIINGSTFGGLITGPNSGHLVVRIRNNDNDDSFAVVANSENSASAAPDKVLFRAKSTGQVEIPGDLTVEGIVTAQEFHTEFVSASIVYQSGSTKFGDTSDDVHQFTGSLELTGSLILPTDVRVYADNELFLHNGGDVLFPNTFIGNDAGNLTSTGTGRNIGIGQDALQSLTTGLQNVAIGWLAGQNITDSLSNTLIGTSAGRNITTGDHNTALGAGALASITTDSSNVGIGSRTFENLSSGTGNIGIGYAVFEQIPAGSHNIAMGTQAGRFNKGSSNVAIGFYSLSSPGSGSSNIAIGYQALQTTTEDSNVAVGYQAGRAANAGGTNDTGSNSVFVGYQAYPSGANDTNEIVIGYQAIGLGSNTAVLGNDNITTTVLKGNVGIGTTSPQAKLDVSGSAQFYSVDIFNGDQYANPRLRIGRSTAETLNFDVDDYVARIYHKQDETGTQVHKLNLTVDSDSTGGSEINLGFRDSDGSNESTKLIISSSGNVGIGTTTPQRLLDVNGDVRVKRNIYGADGSYIGFFADGGSAIPVKAGSLTISNTYNDTAPTNGLYVQGDAGIGTTNVSARLHLSGSTGSSILRMQSPSANTLAFNHYSGYSTLRDITLSNNRLLFLDSGAITTPYNIGIGLSGATAPAVPLHVSGTFRHDGSQYNIQLIGGSEIRGSNAVTLRGLNSYAAILAAGSILYTAGTDHIFRDTNSNALVTIKQAGNVGIGINNPSDFNSAASNLVVGTGAGSNGISIYSGTSSAGGLYFADASGSGAGNRDGVINYNHSTATMDLKTGGNQRVLSLNTGTSTFNLGDVVMENDLTVKGIVTAQEFHTEFVSASIIYQSGSTKFGDTSDDIHSFTGSVNILGPVTATSFTGSLYTTPTTPTNLSLTQEDGTVIVQFTSASGEVHRYEVWSSVGDETNYNLIGALNEDNFTASIQIVDDTFNKNDTIYYTVYSLRNGKYSDSLTGNITVTGNVADVTGMRVMEALHGYHLEWILPDDNRLQQVNVKVDSSDTLAGLSEANSTTFYSGLAEQTFYEVPEADANKYHQFWIDSVTRT